MKAIVLLFTNKTGRIGSEDYFYPKIEKANVTIEGNPNMIRFYSEAKRVFKLWTAICSPAVTLQRPLCARH